MNYEAVKIVAMRINAIDQSITCNLLGDAVRPPFFSESFGNDFPVLHRSNLNQFSSCPAC